MCTTIHGVHVFYSLCTIEWEIFSLSKFNTTSDSSTRHNYTFKKIKCKSWICRKKRHLLVNVNIEKWRGEKKKNHGSGGIRTHATFVTGALNQRLRPLGHATIWWKAALHCNFNHAPEKAWLLSWLGRAAVCGHSPSPRDLATYFCANVGLQGRTDSPLHLRWVSAMLSVWGGGSKVVSYIPMPVGYTTVLHYIRECWEQWRAGNVWGSCTKRWVYTVYTVGGAILVVSMCHAPSLSCRQTVSFILKEQWTWRTKRQQR